jgi:hypothetical protein
MEITLVIHKELRWGRCGLIELIGEEVVIDTSDGEYGPLVIPIELLEQKLKEHKEKLK